MPSTEINLPSDAKKYFLKALEDFEWSDVIYLCCDEKTLLDGKHIVEAFLHAAFFGQVEVLRALLTRKEDKIPSHAVNSALLNARKTHDWTVAEYLCSLESDNKPDQLTIDSLLAAVREEPPSLAVGEFEDYRVEEGTMKETKKRFLKRSMGGTNDIQDSLSEAASEVSLFFSSQCTDDDWNIFPAFLKQLYQLATPDAKNQNFINEYFFDAVVFKRAPGPLKILNSGFGDIVDLEYLARSLNYGKKKALTPLLPKIISYIKERSSSPEVVQNLISQMVREKNWMSVAILCIIDGEKKPNAETVAYAFKEACAYNNVEVVHALCKMKTDNKPNTATLNDELKKAAQFNKWEIVDILCKVAGDNVPDRAVIDGVLKSKAEHIQALDKRDEEERQREEQEKQQRKEQDQRDAEARRAKQAAEEEEQRKRLEKIESDALMRHKESMTTIDQALNTLKDKVMKIDKKHSQRAHDKASELLDALKLARDEYNSCFVDSKTQMSDAAAKFRLKCSNVINQAKPDLQRDLGWGSYLNNLLKIITNAVVWVFTLGNKDSFFKPQKSELLKAFEDHSLDPEIKKNSPNV